MTYHFISVLGPYRGRIMKLIKTRFCLTAASLSSKTPLPHDTQFEDWVANVTHDALVQSQVFAKTPQGISSIQNGEFTRYWFVVVGAGGWTSDDCFSGSTCSLYLRWASSLASLRMRAEPCLGRLRTTLDCHDLNVAHPACLPPSRFVS